MNRRLDKQKGFAPIWLIVGAIVLAVGFGAYLSGSKVNVPPLSEKTAQLASVSVIEQGTLIIGGIQQMAGNSRALTEITDNATDDGTSGTYGLYHPTVGGAQVQVPNRDAVTTNTSKWVLKIDATKTTDATRATFVASGVGTASPDYAAVLPEVSLTACRQINVAQHRALSTDEPDVVTTGASSDFTTPASSVVTDAVKHANWSSGCVKTTDGKYAYFAVIKPN